MLTTILSALTIALAITFFAIIYYLRRQNRIADKPCQQTAETADDCTSQLPDNSKTTTLTSDPTSAPTTNANDEKLMDSIMTALNANIGNCAFNVDKLSSSTGLSRAQLHRRVKEITGISCGTLLRNFRLDHAARLLLSKPGMPISHIATASGFANPTNFATTFKKRFGMPPSEYALTQQQPL